MKDKKLYSSNQFGQYAVVGITSFGVKCKDPTFPGNVLVSSNVQSNCELELSLVLVLWELVVKSFMAMIPFLNYLLQIWLDMLAQN